MLVHAEEYREIHLSVFQYMTVSLSVTDAGGV